MAFFFSLWLRLTLMGVSYFRTSSVSFQNPDSFTGSAFDSPKEHPSRRLNTEQFAGQGLVLSRQPSCLLQQTGFLLSNSILAKEKND